MGVINSQFGVEKKESELHYINSQLWSLRIFKLISHNSEQRRQNHEISTQNSEEKKVRNGSLYQAIMAL